MSQAGQISITSGPTANVHKRRTATPYRGSANSVACLARKAVAADVAYIDVVLAHRAAIGPWPAVAEAELDRHSAAYRHLIGTLIASPSSSFADCQAKARALRTCPDNVELVNSLLDDLESLR